MEIERKYLIKAINTLPFNLNDYPHHEIEQAYLNTEPVIRVRRKGNDYYLTYKGKGLMVREEYNLPLTADAYAHLLKKADGNIITKTRYLIPLNENNLDKDLSIQNISQSIHISQSVLYKYFRNYFSCSVGEYINTKRIEKSMRFFM